MRGFQVHLLKALGRLQLRSSSQSTGSILQATAFPRPLSIQLKGFRLKSTSTNPRPQSSATSTGGISKAPAPKLAYPERLCIYHAGTGRIVFLACLKLSTLFIFAFYAFVATPTYLKKDGLSPTVARTALSAIIPLAFVAYSTSPFVTVIHMRLPPFARHSQEMLRRFAARLPRDTELDVWTMSLVARPRLSRVKLGDLRPVVGRTRRRRLGIVNMTRDTGAENARRRWYAFRAVRDFNVLANTEKRVPWVWEQVWGGIARQA